MGEHPADHDAAGAHDGDVLVHVSAAGDVDDEELAELVSDLREALLELDVQRAVALTEDDAPDGAKGVAAVAGWLAVTLGPTAAKAVVERVAAWAGLQGRTVEISLGQDTLKVAGVSRAEQRRLIDEWLARQAPVA